MAFRSIDFEIIKEPWNKYELGDGSVLKTRFILKKVQIAKVDANTSNFNIDGENMTVIFAAPELKGEPSNQVYTPIDLKAAIIKDDIRYSTVQEEWNEYLLDDASRIRVKTTVTKVSRTSKFEKTGDPIYLVDTNALMDFKKPNPSS